MIYLINYLLIGVIVATIDVTFRRKKLDKLIESTGVDSIYNKYFVVSIYFIVAIFAWGGLLVMEIIDKIIKK